MTTVRTTTEADLPQDVSTALSDLWARRADDEVSNTLNRYLHVLNVDMGWPYRRLSAAMGCHVNTVISRARKGADADSVDVGHLPVVRREEPEPARLQRYQLPSDVRRRLRSLHQIARQRSGTTATNRKVVEAGNKFTELVIQEREKGATLVSIADAAGVTTASLQQRLGRYGYRRLPPSQRSTMLMDLRQLDKAEEGKDS